ncbi:hypothetical protein VNO77_19679 [Canavalia gladiata]|uniref:Retropepsins domain-containing protein n=1 Tax=Canavalia gladiata TaxID=3824 RepID=A0AAN9LRZ5_CANGL
MFEDMNLFRELVFMAWTSQKLLPDGIASCPHNWEQNTQLPYEYEQCSCCPLRSVMRARLHCPDCKATMCNMCSPYQLSRTLTPAPAPFQPALTQNDILIGELTAYIQYLQAENHRLTQIIFDGAQSMQLEADRIELERKGKAIVGQTDLPSLAFTAKRGGIKIQEPNEGPNFHNFMTTVPERHKETTQETSSSYYSTQPQDLFKQNNQFELEDITEEDEQEVAGLALIQAQGKKQPVNGLYNFLVQFFVKGCSPFTLRAVLDTGATTTCIHITDVPKEALMESGSATIVSGLNSEQYATKKIKQEDSKMMIDDHSFRVPFTLCFPMNLAGGIQMLLGTNFVSNCGGGIRIEGRTLTFYKQITNVETSRSALTSITERGIPELEEQCPEKLESVLLLTEEVVQIRKDIVEETMGEEVNGMERALALNIQQFLKVYTTPSQYYRRYERIREASSKGHVMKYGQTQLPILSHDDPSAFKPLPDLPVDPQQRKLLNAVWKTSTKRTKHQILNALQFYFSRIMTPPLGKGFAYYALARGPRKRLYCKYSTLFATVGESRNCYWKEFYSFIKAYDYLLNFCRDTEQIYIEEEDHQGLTQNLQEEIAELTDLIAEERAELFRLQRTLSQQESRLAIQAVPHDEFRRKMTLMSSFRNNFMTGLLKQGGTRCCNLIHSLAQDQHYNHLRELQMKIFVTPALKELYPRHRLQGSWVASCQKIKRMIFPAYKHYSPLLVEVQLRGSGSNDFKEHYNHLRELQMKISDTRRTETYMEDMTFCREIPLPGYYGNQQRKGKLGVRKATTYKGKPHETHIRAFKTRKPLVNKCKCFICGKEGH